MSKKITPIEMLLARLDEQLHQDKAILLAASEVNKLRAMIAACRAKPVAKSKPGLESKLMRDGASWKFISADAGAAVPCELCARPANGARLRLVGKVKGKADAQFKVEGVAHVGCVERRDAWFAASLTNADALRQSYFDAQAMRYCACEHGADAHAEEKATGNLMKCAAAGCDCDHFHYEEKAAA
jgi:hypothetical protein